MIRLFDLFASKLSEKEIFINKEDIEQKYEFGSKRLSDLSVCDINDVTFHGLYKTQFPSFVSSIHLNTRVSIASNLEDAFGTGNSVNI